MGNKIFPIQIPVEVDEKISLAFIKEHIDDFLSELSRSREYTIYEYITDHEEDVREFILSGGVDR